MSARRSHFWRQQVFALVMYGCVLFIVLTSAAMFFYPGGSLADPTTSGYSFATNFLSELGITTTRAGRANTISAILWFTALTMAGAGLILFSFAFRRFFVGSRLVRALSTIGSVSGLTSGLGFIGVAFAPANLRLQAHMAWLIVAFVAFPVAVVCYAAAILREPGYPNRYGYVFAGFAVLLALYVALMMAGPGAGAREAMTAADPGPGSRQALMIQAVGQKVIVYASILTIYFQARGAREMARIRGVWPGARTTWGA